MDGLTPQDIARLAEPFEADEHDFKNELAYIDKEAIMARLNEIDPNWTLEITRNGTDGDAVMVYGAMTLKGVRRDNVGGDAILRTKYDKERKQQVPLGDFQIAENTVNAHKTAATDLLQRCAQSFGVGMYLKRAKVKDASALRAWLNKEFGGQPNRPAPIHPVRAVQSPPPAPTFDEQFPKSAEPNPFAGGGTKRDQAWERTKGLFNHRAHFDNLMEKLQREDKVHREMTVDELVRAINLHYEDAPDEKATA